MLLVILLLNLVACGQITASISAKNPSSLENDFVKSEVISNGPGIADGRSELILVVRLVNSDGSPVYGFRPTYEIVSGTGIIPSDCTLSDNTGTSVCVLRATVAGLKRLSVNNIKIELMRDIDFLAPSGKGHTSGLVVSAIPNNASSSGHVLQAAIEPTMADQPKISTSGWKMSVSVQGAILLQ